MSTQKKASGIYQSADIQAKPDPVIVNPDSIPESLKNLDKWICWKWELIKKKDGTYKWDKPPYRADGKGKASSTDPTTWTTFSGAYAAYQSGGFDGIGFVLTDNDPFVMVDLDKCLDEQWALEMMSDLDSYSEGTPSGKGYRTIVEAEKPEQMGCTSSGFHEGRVEVYENGRYMTVTGNHIEGTPKEINYRQTELEFVCAPLMKQAKAKSTPTDTSGTYDMLAGSYPPASAEHIRDVLSYISNHGEGQPYEDSFGPSYMGVMMGVHNETNGNGFDLFRSWSAQSAKHEEQEDYRKWQSLTVGGGIAFGSVVKWAQDNGMPKGGNQSSDPSTAQKLATRIDQKIGGMIECDSPELLEPFLTSIKADTAIIDRMINASFWSGSKGKLFMLNRDEGLIQFTERDAFKFLPMQFGNIINRDKVIAAVDSVREWADTNADQDRRTKLINTIVRTGTELVMDHLKYANQRESIEWRVDMFAAKPRLNLKEDMAQIVLTHKPYQCQHQFTPEIIEDYKQHFPRLDELLTFLIMSRFAMDRKKCYLWLKADSDWGKGFLIEGVLGKALNATVSTSMREIEAMFEGKPVGRSPLEFKRSLALVIDEFKTVKSELKQLQSHITLSPKNQLASRVEIFAKVLMSAESVASLVTENGVEDQFANRMSIFIESGSLDQREVFQRVGKPSYFNAVLAYVVGKLNAGISAMRAKGELKAQTEAESWIDGFIDRYGIGTVYQRFSETLPEVAEDVVRWIHSTQRNFKDRLVGDNNGNWYLKQPSKVLEDYFEEHFTRSEIGAYRKKRDELLDLMSADGKGVTSHRVHGDPTRCVYLNKMK